MQGDPSEALPTHGEATSREATIPSMNQPQETPAPPKLPPNTFVAVLYEEVGTVPVAIVMTGKPDELIRREPIGKQLAKDASRGGLLLPAMPTVFEMMVALPDLRLYIYGTKPVVEAMSVAKDAAERAAAEKVAGAELGPTLAQIRKLPTTKGEASP